MKKILSLILVVFCSISIYAQNFQWARSIGGIGYDGSYGVKVGANGDVYIAGWFSGTIDFDPGPGVYLLASDSNGSTGSFACKLDAAGNFIWAKVFGSSGYDGCYTLALGNTDEVYLAGNFSGTADFDPGTGTHYITSAGSDDAYVSKLDSSGNFLWAAAMGGNQGGDVSNCIAVGPSGNCYVTGFFVTTGDFDPGPGVHNLATNGYEDIFVCALDASGNFRWAYGIGGTEYDWGISVAVDEMENVYLTGEIEDSVDFDPGPGTVILSDFSGTGNTYLCTYNMAGDFRWAKQLVGPGSDGVSVVVSTAYVYSCGLFYGSTDFDPGPGNYTLTSAGSYDNIYIQKLDTSGNFVWAKQISANDYIETFSMTADAAGNTFLSAHFEGTVDADPGANVYALTAAGASYDIVIQRLDANGIFLSARQIGGPGEDIDISIAAGPQGNVYVAGSFTGTCDFDPGAGSFPLTATGISDDIFVLKLDSTLSTSVKDAEYLQEPAVYHNGAGQVVITGLRSPVESVEVVDAGGKVIWRIGYPQSDSEKTVLRIPELRAGVYFIRLGEVDAGRTLKFVLVPD